MHPNNRADEYGNEWLNEAVANRSPIMLHVRTKSGWATWKSQLLAGEADTLTIAHPHGVRPGEADIALGQTIGISLRRGHKKCMFDADVISQDSQTGAMVISRPQEMQQMQRRVYNRARVPDHITIPVNVSRLDSDGTTEQTAVPRRGVLLDLSGGGMSIAVSGDARNKWRRGDMIRCFLPLEPAREPQLLTARLRFVEKAPQGHLRMGMQFVGLEASNEGRSTLKVIARATSRFRGAVGRSTGRGLAS